MSRAVHHLDLWVSDLAVAEAEWGWLLGELGWEADTATESGCSWVHQAGTYPFLAHSPDQSAVRHDRRRPGLNHLARPTSERAPVGRIRRESATVRDDAW